MANILTSSSGLLFTVHTHVSVVFLCEFMSILHDCVYKFQSLNIIVGGDGNDLVSVELINYSLRNDNKLAASINCCSES